MALFDEMKKSVKTKLNVKSGNNARLRKPVSPEFKQYMSEGWRDQPPQKLEVVVPKQYATIRRTKLSGAFPKDRLIIEAGDLKTRNNDCDYRFRPSTAFTYLTGLGMDYEPGGVVVFEPVKVTLPNSLKQSPKSSKTKSADKASRWTHIATLYIEPSKDRSSSEFFTSSQFGEFWIGPRPALSEFEDAIGMRVRPKAMLKEALKKRPAGNTRVWRENDPNNDAKLEEFLSELRLVKDVWEIGQMRDAIAKTKEGFERVIRDIPQIVGQPRGERMVEARFVANSIERGNAVGYETIAAAGEHATYLHWIRNTGTLNEGELLLMDAGVEIDSLYTADITRTFPISGQFNMWQRQIYDAVLLAANAGIKMAVPGNKFSDVHDAAVRTLTEEMIKLGMITVSLEEALEKELVRRWMCHGTSHHLGLDVHDCASARSQEYLGELKPGMILTVEPGLYFHTDDTLAIKEYRGIGVRIEDDILITEDGNENLSESLPRNPEHVLSWMKDLQGKL